MIDIFRMVRSVGDLPNVHYVLAFDRSVVAKALSDVTVTNGDRYVEKIIQAPFSLPRAGQRQPRSERSFETAPARCAGGHDSALFDAQYWSELLVYGVFPFLPDPRDIVRLINALAVIYPSVSKRKLTRRTSSRSRHCAYFAPDAYEILRSILRVCWGT